MKISISGHTRAIRALLILLIATGVSVADGYTVRPGDTVSTILLEKYPDQRIYGRGHLLAKTIELNPALAPAANRVATGDVLILPGEETLRIPASASAVVEREEAAAPSAPVAPATPAPVAAAVPASKEACDHESFISVVGGLALNNTLITSRDSNGNSAELVSPLGTVAHFEVIQNFTRKLSTSVEFQSENLKFNQNAQNSVRSKDITLNSFFANATYALNDSSKISARLGSNANAYLFAPQPGVVAANTLSPLSASLSLDQTLRRFEHARVGARVTGSVTAPVSDNSLTARTGYGASVRLIGEQDLSRHLIIQTSIDYGFAQQDTDVSKQDISQYGISLHLILPLGGR